MGMDLREGSRADRFPRVEGEMDVGRTRSLGCAVRGHVSSLGATILSSQLRGLCSFLRLLPRLFPEHL